MTQVTQEIQSPRVTLGMGAALLATPGVVRLASAAVPDPGPGEVRVRLEGCGVCGSDRPLWEGRSWFAYPRSAGAPGHEGWGVVDAVGEQVTGMRPGQRVTMLSERAFAEFDVAPVDAVVPLPAALDGKPFPGEALGCAMNVFRRSIIRRGQRVAIIGIGFLGALLVQLAFRAGAHVLAISRRRFALDVARDAGADAVLDLDDSARTAALAREWTGGRGFDRVIEATGVQAALDLAGEITAERGLLAIAGYHQDGLRSVNLQLWNWQGLDVVNAHERDPRVHVEGIRAAIRAVTTGGLDPAPLYTHRFPLAEVDRALDAMRDRPEGFLKALVIP